MQAVGSLVAKATGAFRRIAAMRMPNRMSEYGLKRPDIFLSLLMNSVFHSSNSSANKTEGHKYLKISGDLINFKASADGSLIISIDNFVEAIESYLNHFIDLKEKLFQQVRLEMTGSSKCQIASIFSRNAKLR
jgi:hypothetical protein